jgi:hypothetical protein
MSLGQLADSRSTTLPACAGDADSCPAPADGEASDYLLASPDPGSCTAPPLAATDRRLAEASDHRLAAQDQRVVDLHTALTAAGVPPEAGDTTAIHVLAALDDETVNAVIRWVRGRFML